jgi:hypothetical protein
MTDRDRDSEKNEIRDHLDKDLKPDAQESLNEYYTRKQRVTESVLSGDASAELVDNDDSFAEERLYRKDADAGPRNTKPRRRGGAP